MRLLFFSKIIALGLILASAIVWADNEPPHEFSRELHYDKNNPAYSPEPVPEVLTVNFQNGATLSYTLSGFNYIEPNEAKGVDLGDYGKKQLDKITFHDSKKSWEVGIRLSTISLPLDPIEKKNFDIIRPTSYAPLIMVRQTFDSLMDRKINISKFIITSFVFLQTERSVFFIHQSGEVIRLDPRELWVNPSLRKVHTVATFFENFQKTGLAYSDFIKDSQGKEYLFIAVKISDAYEQTNVGLATGIFHDEGWGIILKQLDNGKIIKVKVPPSVEKIKLESAEDVKSFLHLDVLLDGRLSATDPYGTELEVEGGLSHTKRAAGISEVPGLIKSLVATKDSGDRINKYFEISQTVHNLPAHVDNFSQEQKEEITQNILNGLLEDAGLSNDSSLMTEDPSFISNFFLAVSKVDQSSIKDRSEFYKAVSQQPEFNTSLRHLIYSKLQRVHLENQSEFKTWINYQLISKLAVMAKHLISLPDDPKELKEQSEIETKFSEISKNLIKIKSNTPTELKNLQDLKSNLSQTLDGLTHSCAQMMDELSKSHKSP